MQKAEIIAIGDGKNKNNISLTVLLQTNDRKSKRKFEVTQKDYERLDFPEIGRELSEYDLKILSKSSCEKDAVAIALRILAHGDNNRFNLKGKLLHKGFGEEIAELTVEKMVELGFVNEYDQAYRYAIQLANQKLYGENKIIPFLLSKGYSKEDIENAIRNAVADDEIDFESIKKRLCEKNGISPENAKEIKSILYKYGHSSGFDF